MTTPINVNITSDISSGRGWHLFAPSVLPTLTALAVAAEVPTRMDWAPGKLKSSHSLTTSVKHRSSSIVLSGHDCGWLITDEALFLPALANGHIALMALVSSRAVVYTASTVKMDGKETGLASWGPQCPMLSCGEPCPSPLVKSDTSFGNSLVVGATTGDINVGDFTVTMKMAVGVLSYTIEAILSLIAPEAEPIEAIEPILEKLLPSQPGIKDLLGVVSSGAISAYASYQSGWTKPISLTMTKSTPGSGYAVSLTYDPSTREVSLGETSTVGIEKTTESIPIGQLKFDSLTPNTGFPNSLPF